MGRKNKRQTKQKPPISLNENNPGDINAKENILIAIADECNKDSLESKIAQEINNNEYQINSISSHEIETTQILLELKLTKDIHNKSESNSKSNKRREFYLNYLCQICQSLVDRSECCRKCHMISYCSPEHRRKHWPIHADICKAIQDICQKNNKEHILQNTNNITAELFRTYCYNLMEECKTKIQRNLEEWEIEFFLFPNVCDTCYNWNSNELLNCSGCHHISYCKNKSDHLKPSHKNDCHSLAIYKKILQYQFDNGAIPTHFPETNDVKDMLESQNITGILKHIKTELNELEYLQLTEIATAPLTAAYNIQLYHKRISKQCNETLTIHIVGAEKHFELNLLQKWEIFFLHFFNKVQNLNLIFIGPEININNKEEVKQLQDIKLCDKCLQQKRKINCEFYDKTFYHNYIHSVHDQIKPDLICAFNAGIYRTTGYNERDTWPETIKAMFKIKHTPVLVTAYTSAEILKDIKRITSLQKCEVIKMPNQNPYTSLKPNLNFVSREETPVIYKNYYFILLSS